MNEDKISVIVPIYNCEQYIERCVKSIINQSYKNIEIILVDDGSTDASPKICDSFAQKDSRVKVIHKSNSGVAHSRECGVLQSSGDYITFVDSDDWIKSDMLEHLYRLIKSGDYRIASCDYELKFDENILDENTPVKTVELDFCDMIKYLFDYSLWSIWAKLYKRDLYFKAEKPKEKLTVGEDLLQNYFIFKMTDKMIVSNKKGYIYFRHKGSVMAKDVDIDRLNNQLKSYRIIYNDFDKNSPAFPYQAANRILNDFNLLNTSIIQNAGSDCI
ncbi:MAG: glycosyltransferase, partial [Clostridiales bacterium]|nr:glycosyltransferase [Clostridiales bacterium]